MSGKWHADKKKAHQDELRLRGTSQEIRDRYGCICTLRNEDNGEIVTLQRNGFRRDALRAIADWCDRAAGDWKVVSYSTPETILGDLRGDRVTVAVYEQTTQATLAMPEAEALGNIGRYNLLAPELTAHVNSEARRIRENA